MGTEILKSFGTLQSELEQAKSSLKGVDENIKRLIGRDPSELPGRPSAKRNVPNEERARPRLGRIRNFNHENDEPPPKRRPSAISVFKRLSDRPNQYEEDLHQQPQKQMISKVIVTPKELPSRQEALEAQSKDERSKARNRRMFGALLGTLQKFQQEETKLKQKEDKRAQLEKKIEEHEIKEKEEIKKERQELFLNRKKKQAEIKMIELKMMRMKEYAAWEERQKPRMNFIQTKTKPQICYLPRRMTEGSKKLLEACKTEIEKMIDKKRQEVFDELQHIEDRMKKNFELRKHNKGDTETHEEKNDVQVNGEHEEERDGEGEIEGTNDEKPDEENMEPLIEGTNIATVDVNVSENVESGQTHESSESTTNAEVQEELVGAESTAAESVNEETKANSTNEKMQEDDDECL